MIITQRRHVVTQNSCKRYTFPPVLCKFASVGCARRHPAQRLAPRRWMCYTLLTPLARRYSHGIHPGIFDPGIAGAIRRNPGGADPGGLCLRAAGYPAGQYLEGRAGGHTGPPHPGGACLGSRALEPGGADTAPLPGGCPGGPAHVPAGGDLSPESVLHAAAAFLAAPARGERAGHGRGPGRQNHPDGRPSPGARP